VDRSALLEVHERLLAAQAAAGGREAATVRFERVRAALDEARREEAAARELCEQGRVEVRRLSRPGVTGIAAALRGRRGAMREDAAVALSRNEARLAKASAGLGAAEAEARALEDELPALIAAQQRVMLVMEEKRQAILTSGGRAREELVALAPRIEAAASRQREITEALAAGEVARAALRQLLDTLSSARSWGVADLVGGGMITSLAKHSKLGAARGHARRVTEAMAHFQRELGDVDATALSPDIGRLATFTDWAVDNVVSDWFVQSRIEKARDRVHETLRSVEAALTRLREEGTATASALARDYARQVELVETAV